MGVFVFWNPGFSRCTPPSHLSYTSSIRTGLITWQKIVRSGLKVIIHCDVWRALWVPVCSTTLRHSNYPKADPDNFQNLTATSSSKETYISDKIFTKIRWVIFDTEFLTDRQTPRKITHFAEVITSDGPVVPLYGPLLMGSVHLFY